jgi:rhodanese-related sulfurtransferase
MSNRHSPDQGVPIPEITVREAWQRLEADEPKSVPTLVDVREAWEYAQGHAARAVNIPLSELQARAGEVPRDRDVLLICQVGQRSFAAARFLRNQGVERVINVDGGTEAWEAARLPMEQPHP